MSLPRPSGLKAPSGSKLARPSTGIPQKSGLMPPGSISRTQSATAQSARIQGEKHGTGPLGEEDISPKMDDFIVGDRVFVSGSKSGIIAYIGETQFAPGDWAGVVLDETIGKNDGSVNGVRYFQCEAKHGVFCRVSKLSRTPEIASTLRSTDDGASVTSMPVNGDNTPVNKRPTTPSMQYRPTTPSHGDRSMLARPTTPTSLPRPMNKSLSNSNTSLNRGPTASKVKSDSQVSTPSVKSSSGLKIGERVLVSGSKLGTLRYLGPTDFAKGDWAGVELDDPVGKNDGAVAGKRYFSCRPRYGLFAPEHKVSKTSVTSTPSSMTRSLPGMRLSRERSGSQESVSSLSSATSSASRPRPTTGRTSQRPSSLNVSATTSALQKALKEKEEHIEQLLRERDLERSEVARAAAQVDEAQDQLIQLRAERERQQDEKEDNIQQLRAKIQKLIEDKHDLELKLDDEKRKVEDLQFQIEEEVISKDDLETVKSKTEEEEAKIRDLEKCLKREKERSDKLEGEVNSLKKMKERQENQMKEMEETQTSYLDQIEELTHKFAQAEIKIQTYDSSRLEEGAKTSQVSLELEEKSAKVSELEDFLSLKTKEVKQLQEKLSELKDDLESRNSKMEKLQNNYDELMGKLKANEVFSNNLSIEVQDLKLKNSDLERQLKDSLEKSKQLSEEKSQLELQIADMMKNSGDSSNQLSMLNDQLGQKTRKLEELQADLSTSTQKWHNLNSQFENSIKDKDKTIENLKSSYEEKISTLNVNIEDVQKELGKAKNKIVNMEKDFESEKDSLVQRKDNEISELKQQLENVNEKLSDQEIQTQAHKQLLDKITMEKEAVQFEREKVEKQVKRLETERDSLNNDLIQVKVDAAKTKSTLEELNQEKSTVNDRIQDLMDEKQRLEKTISDLQKSRDDAVGDKEKISSEKDQYQREVMESRASLQQKEMLVEELQKEVEKLKQESSQQKETIHQLSQQTTDSGVMQKKIAEQMSLVETLKSQLADKDKSTKEIQDRFDEQESQMRSMKIELEDTLETVTLLEENVKSLETDKEKVLELNKKLNEQIDSIHQSHRSEVEGLKSMEENLQAEISNTKSMFQQKEDELRAKISQITNLENEKLMLIGYKSANEKLEEETLDLRGKINQLQTKLADVQTNANVITKLETTTTNNNEENNTLVDQLMEDKIAAQGQVEFLNSVIVDLQHKNEELKTRLEIMEQGVPNGEDEMEINTPTRRAAPRMYCDICDIFDQHETEDCPLQESSDSPPPSQYHGDRHQIRPYCDICEEFHPPCPGLSAKKVVAASGAEPIDPKSKVEDWVKAVDTVTSELNSESEKVFGNDGEFFHVQQDPHEAPGFRDSGYYDSVDTNIKSPFDMKPGLSLLSSVSEITEAEKQNIWDKLKKEATKTDLKELHVSDKQSPIDQKQKESSNEVNRKRPNELGTLGNREDKGDYSQSTKTPMSITSVSDSEYQSGMESLNSQSGSPGTPDETSVDTGEVFPSDEQNNDDKTDTDADKTAENCVVS